MFDFVKKKKQKLVILGESMLKKPLVKKKTSKSKKAKIKVISSIALKDDQVQRTQTSCNYTL